MKLEIACFNVSSALIALSSKVDRIEFCADFSAGGITPNVADFLLLKSTSFAVPIYVMIRPRGGNFVYTETEFLQMKQQLLAFKEAGADGFVFGILKEDHSIDMEQNQELISLAAGVPCTFHRAFDLVQNGKESLEQLIELGFTTVLTSGLHKNVMEGALVLKELIKQADNRIEILCGGGLRSSNIQELIKITEAKAFHSSAITSDSLLADVVEIEKLLSCIQA